MKLPGRLPPRVNCLLQVKVTRARKARILEAAQLNHQTVSDFVRDAVDSAIADCLEPPTTSAKNKA